MTAESYVNGIVKKIHCGGSRKKEIKKQLLADIHMQTEQGTALEEVIEQMGSAQEIADSFNEELSKAERRKYSWNRILKICIPIAAVLLVLIWAGYWFLPKGADLSQSDYFEQETVERKMQETVTLLNAGDYETLCRKAIPEMQPYLTEEGMEKIMEQIADDWGEFRQFGAIYTQELIQGKNHYAVGEITVAYENVNVIFRLTYDTDMKLAGLYIR